MKNHKVLVSRIVLSTLSVFMISFIFINSLFDAELSSAQSGNVLAFINSLFASLNINISFTEHFVRKCAHFAEFFALGTILFYTVKAFFAKLLKSIFLTLFIGLFVAATDETLQLFSAGRSAQLSDVLLDFFAVVVAAAVFSTLTLLIQKRLRNKGLKNE